MNRNRIELDASIRGELLTELVCMIGVLAPEVRPTVIRRTLTFAPEQSFELSCLVGEYRAVSWRIVCWRSGERSSMREQPIDLRKSGFSTAADQPGTVERFTRDRVRPTRSD